MTPIHILLTADQRDRSRQILPNHPNHPKIPGKSRLFPVKMPCNGASHHNLALELALPPRNIRLHIPPKHATISIESWTG